jgi:transcriptional regulator with XRE-family HTH domain
MPQGAHDVDFGAMLRHAREERGVSLRAIAEATKISLPALEALEHNDISHLPGGIFTRAFVRGYAREVGLDPEDTVKQFIEAFPDEAPSTADGSPRSAPRREVRVEFGVGATRTIGRILTVVAAITLLVAYLAWSGRLASWQRGPAVAAPPPGSVPPPLLVEPMEETVGVPPADVPGAILLIDRTASAGVLPAEEPPAPAVVVDPASQREDTLRLSLSASGRCWVSLRSNGVHSFAGTMEAGDQREVDVHGRVSLTVGDAGVFSYSINGLPARPMGGAGEVVTVVFTAENYRSFLQGQ